MAEATAPPGYEEKSSAPPPFPAEEDEQAPPLPDKSQLALPPDYSAGPPATRVDVDYGQGRDHRGRRRVSCVLFWAGVLLFSTLIGYHLGKRCGLYKGFHIGRHHGRLEAQMSHESHHQTDYRCGHGDDDHSHPRQHSCSFNDRHGHRQEQKMCYRGDWAAPMVEIAPANQRVLGSELFVLAAVTQGLEIIELVGQDGPGLCLVLNYTVGFTSDFTDLIQEFLAENDGSVLDALDSVPLVATTHPMHPWQEMLVREKLGGLCAGETMLELVLSTGEADCSAEVEVVLPVETSVGQVDIIHPVRQEICLVLHKVAMQFF